QVTGKKHWHIEHYIVCIISGAAPQGVIAAIYTLIDFCYVALSPVISKDGCERIEKALMFTKMQSLLQESEEEIRRLLTTGRFQSLNSCKVLYPAFVQMDSFSSGLQTSPKTPILLRLRPLQN
ncbi:hypothetical protein BDN67DRAFT_913918, partial [Paxillus ammoniavirescens]